MSFFKGLMGVFASPKVHFSQFGEDIFVTGFFKDQNEGTFVDVGCFHPYYASNTLRLYWRGWRGINIDMDTKKMRLFRWFRSRDRNLQAAVSDQPGKPVKIVRPSASSYGSMDRLAECETADAELKTRTLNEILTDEGCNKVDFLSIDVEGHDLAVLRGMDLAKYQPKLICVELHKRALPEILSSEVNQHLEKSGYNIVAWNPPSVFYSKPEYLPRRENP